MINFLKHQDTKNTKIPLGSLVPLVSLCLTLLTACTETQEQIEVPTDINRVVSMAPSLTECLFAVGAGDQVVGVTTFCGYPAEANGLPRIGGYTDANYEKIYSLKPDLAILLDEHYTAAERLTQLGIAHVKFDTSTIPAIFNTIEEMGKLLGKGAESRQVIADARTRIEEIREITKDSEPRKVLVSIGRNMGSGGISAVYVAGQTTLYNEMFKIIGAENVYNGDLEYARMSKEGIMHLAPDVIIDLIPDLETSVKMTPEEVRAEWEILKTVPAVKNDQVYVFGGDYVCVPGPRFILILEDIARAVYPENFK
jgi:iron complex transport system substrate-binding protein